MNPPSGGRLGLRGLGRTVLIGLVVGFSVPASTWAAGPPEAPVAADRSAERAAIDAERRQVAASYDLDKAECQGRFMLTQCLDDARNTRRLALDNLQRRQLTLDDAARRERSVKRLQIMQARVRELRPASAAVAAASVASASVAAASAPAGPASSGLAVQPAVRAVVRPVVRATIAPDSPAAPAPTPAATPAATPVRPSAAAASTQALRNQAAFLQRQQQATAHRDAVLARNARKDASKPPAAGLPVPAAAPASH